MIRFILNEKEVSTHLPPGMLVLDYVRYHQHLMGTKIGCREGDCGACTVLVGEIKNSRLEYQSATCCLMPLQHAASKHIVTIEGLTMSGLNAVQQAMSDEAATQCGFCTPGFVVSLAGFCLSNETPDYEKAIASVNGNICRCTGYKSIERAVEKIAMQLLERDGADAITFATSKQMLPAYFTTMQERLQQLQNDISITGKGSKKFIGGGTDLYVQQPEAMVSTKLESLSARQSLRSIYQKENFCYVGAATTVTDIINDPVFQQHFPHLGKFMKLVSSTPIRNMATVGGNLVNASPIGDLTIFFLALDAQLVLSNGEAERNIALRNFYKGYKLIDKKEDEFISQLFFSLPSADHVFNFEKVSKRTHLDIASVNSAISLQLSGDKIVSSSLSAGGVGPVPMYLQKTSQFLVDKTVTADLIFEAIAIAQDEVSPISDPRGSEEYKRLLLGQLIKAHFIELFPSITFQQLLAR